MKGLAKFNEQKRLKSAYRYKKTVSPSTVYHANKLVMKYSNACLQAYKQTKHCSRTLWHSITHSSGAVF